MALANRYTISPIWPGLTGVVIAGGPSLTLKQVRAIAKARMSPSSPFRVIAVNDAIFVAWWADQLHAGDDTWWQQNIQSAHTFRGIRTTLGENVPEPWVSGYLRNTGCEGFDEDPSCCRTGGNSAYQAMSILIHAGVKKIILVGVDMKKAANGDRHWFGDHEFLSAGNREIDYHRNMAKNFPTLLPALEARGVSVVNASPDSALDTFPKTDLANELLRR